MMIRLPDSRDTASVLPTATWVREAATRADSPENAAFAAAAALTTLDALVRREAPWAGAWRQRLALTAAAASAQRAGRTEDEAGLRDALLLTRPGDDPGPGGHILKAWRTLAARPSQTLLTDATLADISAKLGDAADDATIDRLGSTLRPLARRPGNTVIGAANAGTAVITAFTALEPLGFRTKRDLGPWLADAVLAPRLGWPQAVPLVGLHLTMTKPHPSWRTDTGHPGQAIQPSAFATIARSALQAADLWFELGRRADRLLAVAPKLRAKGANAVVETLLSDEAIVASREIVGMSDRGLRRLFDRLVALDAVRELSGRATFRLYGL